MHNRRSFIKSASIYSAGILVAPSIPSFFKGKHPAIGLQLYTVRDAMQKDPGETLAKVAQIGFNSLEGATYTGTEMFYGMNPKTFKEMLKKNGLVMRSCHYRLGEDGTGAADGIVKGTILHDWKRAVDDAAALGIKYMVCAWLSPKERLGMIIIKKWRAILIPLPPPAKQRASSSATTIMILNLKCRIINIRTMYCWMKQTQSW